MDYLVQFLSTANYGQFTGAQEKLDGASDALYYTLLSETAK